MNCTDVYRVHQAIGNISNNEIGSKAITTEVQNFTNQQFVDLYFPV